MVANYTDYITGGGRQGFAAGTEAAQLGIRRLMDLEQRAQERSMTLADREEALRLAREKNERINKAWYEMAPAILGLGTGGGVGAPAMAPPTPPQPTKGGAIGYPDLMSDPNAFANLLKETGADQRLPAHVQALSDFRRAFGDEADMVPKMMEMYQKAQEQQRLQARHQALMGRQAEQEKRLQDQYELDVDREARLGEQGKWAHELGLAREARQEQENQEALGLKRRQETLGLLEEREKTSDALLKAGMGGGGVNVFEDPAAALAHEAAAPERLRRLIDNPMMWSKIREGETARDIRNKIATGALPADALEIWGDVQGGDTAGAWKRLRPKDQKILQSRLAAMDAKGEYIKNGKVTSAGIGALKQIIGDYIMGSRERELETMRSKILGGEEGTQQGVSSGLTPEQIQQLKDALLGGA